MFNAHKNTTKTAKPKPIRLLIALCGLAIFAAACGDGDSEQASAADVAPAVGGQSQHRPDRYRRGTRRPGRSHPLRVPRRRRRRQHLLRYLCHRLASRRRRPQRRRRPGRRRVRLDLTARRHRATPGRRPLAALHLRRRRRSRRHQRSGIGRSVVRRRTGRQSHRPRRRIGHC